MSYSEIAFKMFRRNYRRYLLYFLCNAFSIMLFFVFATIFTNESFMDGSIVDISISGNINAPSVVVAIFLAIFVPYSHSAFQKLRRNDYGILLTLGMTEKEVCISMLIENGLVAMISMISGLLIGTVISRVFYWIIINIIGITGFTNQLNIKSYEVTVALYGLIFGITVLVSLFQSLKMQIIDLIKQRYKADKGKQTSAIIFHIGVLAIIGAMILMFFKNGSNIIEFYSMGVFLVGSYLAIGNSDVVIRWIEKSFAKRYRKNFLFYSELKYYFHSLKKILTVMIWLFMWGIFFIVFGTSCYKANTHNAVIYTPYHMEFVKIDGMNDITKGELKKTLNNEKVKVVEDKSLEFLRNGSFTLLSASQVNSVLNRNYRVEKGTFLTIFQEDLKDGYSHDLTINDNLDFVGDKETISLHSAGGKVDILYNINYALRENTLMLNDKDYKKIQDSCSENDVGILRIFNFDNWKESGPVIDNLQQKLNSLNHTNQWECKYYEISSRVETYKIAKQTAIFLVFLCSFIYILFWFSANIMLHFKIQLELESEQRKFKNLYGLGMSLEEMKILIWKKNRFLFLAPVVIGSFIAAFYSCCSYGYWYGEVVLRDWFLIFIAVFIVQWLIVKKYSLYELKKVIII